MAHPAPPQAEAVSKRRSLSDAVSVAHLNLAIEGSFSWYERERRRARVVDTSTSERARDELVTMLDRWPWQWYVTLTFRGSPSIGQAYRAWGSLMAWLREHEASPSYFRGVEWQQRGAPHFHALMFGVDVAARRMAVVDWWFKHYGIARVLPYDPRLGAKGYIAKYMLKDVYRRGGDWTLELDPQKVIEFTSPADVRAVI